VLQSKHWLELVSGCRPGRQLLQVVGRDEQVEQPASGAQGSHRASKLLVWTKPASVQLPQLWFGYRKKFGWQLVQSVGSEPQVAQLREASQPWQTARPACMPRDWPSWSQAEQTPVLTVRYKPVAQEVQLLTEFMQAAQVGSQAMQLNGGSWDEL